MDVRWWHRDYGQAGEDLRIAGRGAHVRDNDITAERVHALLRVLAGVAALAMLCTPGLWFGYVYLTAIAFILAGVVGVLLFTRLLMFAFEGR